MITILAVIILKSKQQKKGIGTPLFLSGGSLFFHAKLKNFFVAQDIDILFFVIDGYSLDVVVEIFDYELFDHIAGGFFKQNDPIFLRIGHVEIF